VKCRHCGSTLTLQLVDLGTAPPSNSYLTADKLNAPEKWLPLRVLVCQTCWLAQTEDYEHQPFDAEYAYFSGFSISWLAHAKTYVDTMTQRFGLGPQSHVVEVASNDGYLLQYVKERGIPCTGIEPTASTANAARAKGIHVVEDFFGARLAKSLRGGGLRANLMAANNVLAHVPDINDFVDGFVELLAPDGVATFEFPHLVRLIAGNQFDTIYFEHYSYLTLTSTQQIFESRGLSIFDVEELSTHGGSLRVYAQPKSGTRLRSPKVDELLRRETDAGVNTAAYYAGFQPRVETARNDFHRFLADAKRAGQMVAGYGAAAKGNTLMNFAGVRSDLVAFVADRSPAKQGRFMPGSQIPIVAEEHLAREKPKYVVIFPWNLKEELARQLEYVKEWGGQLVVAIPQLEILA
jgi:predicted TPR repeat methyltransferase